MLLSYALRPRRAGRGRCFPTVSTQTGPPPHLQTRSRVSLRPWQRLHRHILGLFTEIAHRAEAEIVCFRPMCSACRQSPLGLSRPAEQTGRWPICRLRADDPADVVRLNAKAGPRRPPFTLSPGSVLCPVPLCRQSEHIGRKQRLSASALCALSLCKKCVFLQPVSQNVT